MTAELLDEAPDDIETVTIAWLTPLIADLGLAGGVKNTRRAGDQLPQVIVEYMDGIEDIDCGWADDVVTVYTLVPKGNGDAAAIRLARDLPLKVHRRMLELARYLDDVELPDNRTATIDYVNVFTRPMPAEYADTTILRKAARYKMGLAYAPV